MNNFLFSNLSFVALFLTVMSFAPIASAQMAVEKCEASIQKPNSEFETRVVALSDGDTVHVSGSKPGSIRRIRLLNIDTPETHFMDMSQGYPGELAAAYLAKLVPVGTVVTIKYAEVPCDAYKRHLGFLFKGNSDINMEMVKAGMAVSLCFAPNLAKCKVFTDEAMAVMTNPDRFSVFKTAGKDIPVGKRKDFPAKVPHEFRYETSGKVEAKFVGEMTSKKAANFERFMEIKNPLHRIFFLSEQDVAATGFKLVR